MNFIFFTIFTISFNFTWVTFPVRGNTVSVDQVLEAAGEAVGAVEGRRLLVRLDAVQE